MAKQRPQPKSKGRPGPVSRADIPTRLDGHAPVPSPTPPSTPPAPAAAPAPPPRRSTYFEAVALYERGLEAIQRHDYRSAIDQLESVLRLYPEEKELHERVRLYL